MQRTTDDAVYVRSVAFKIQSSEGHPQQSTGGWGGNSAEVSTGPAVLLMQPWK